MACNRKEFVKVTKFLLAGVAVFCVSWMACVNEGREGVEGGDGDEGLGAGGGGRGGGFSTMRTIVAYSPGKRAEMERPSPVTCERLPAFPKLPHINRMWQPDREAADARARAGSTAEAKSSWQRVFGTTVLLYAAYYDHRLPQRYIRILASFYGRNFTEQELYCQTRQLTPNEDSVEVVAVKPRVVWYKKWDKKSSEVETPVLLSCPLTGPLKHHSIVSVVTQPCNDPTNAFLIEPNETNKYKRNFTICVKDMNFKNDISQDLMEWIETNRILGVDMIDLYIDNISEESEKILLHYRNKGYVRLFDVPIKDKPKRSLWQRRRDHIITYNDCLYRNIEDSAFVAPLDVDEVLLPKVAFTWHQLIERLKHNGWNLENTASILVQNAFFFSFMQGVHEYHHKNLQSKNKIYIKRDDVRIRKTNYLDIGEIELIITNNSSNEVIEDSDKVILDTYKNKCAKKVPVPKILRHIVRSAHVSPIGFYGKSLMVTSKVLTAFNHYPLATLDGATLYRWAPFEEVQLNHYKDSCNSTLILNCSLYGRRAFVDRGALRLRAPLTAALADAICTPIKTT